MVALHIVLSLVALSSFVTESLGSEAPGGGSGRGLYSSQNGLSAKTFFDNVDTNSRNVSAVQGRTGLLTCTVRNLGNRTVSWIRRDKHPEVLSSGSVVFTSDSRVDAKNAAGTDHWTLSINNVEAKDQGIYECQVNTEPKINLAFLLNIVRPLGAPSDMDSKLEIITDLIQQMVDEKEAIIKHKEATIKTLETTIQQKDAIIKNQENCPAGFSRTTITKLRPTITTPRTTTTTPRPSTPDDCISRPPQIVEKRGFGSFENCPENHKGEYYNKTSCAFSCSLGHILSNSPVMLDPEYVDTRIVFTCIRSQWVAAGDKKDQNIKCLTLAELIRENIG